MTEWLCTGNCAASKVFNVKIESAKNPATIASSLNNFVIELLNPGDSARIYFSGTPFTATPALTYSPITPAKVTLTGSSEVTKATSYLFEFTTLAEVP